MTLDERLAAHGDDAVALSAEICEALREARGDDARGEVVQAQVLEALVARPATTLHEVATALVEDEADDGSALLSGLLREAKRRVDEGENGGRSLRAMLAAYTRKASTELQRGASDGNFKTLLSWCDAVADLTVAQEAAEKSSEAVEEAAEMAESTAGAWVAEIAGALFGVHQHSAELRRDFRVMTLVWKNMNKLAAVIRTRRQKLADSEKEDRFAIGTVFDAVAGSLADTTNRLRALSNDAQEESLIPDLKLLRLWLRAFQGQFVHFVDALVAQVECSVALVVDAIAAVMPIAEGRGDTSEKTQHEAFRVLQCAISFFETAAKNMKLQASTRSFVGTLLWQAHDKIFQLVSQTRSQFVENLGESTQDLDIEWAHVFALAAFFAAQGPTERATAPTDEHCSSNVDSDFSSIAALISRYRMWARGVLLNEHSKTVDLFVDFIIDSAVEQAETLHSLQLFLIEQTLHLDMNQQYLMWELWREFICFVWHDELAADTFNNLFVLVCSPNEHNQNISQDSRQNLLRLLTFLYPDTNELIKQECLRKVSAVFDKMCADGPIHKVDLELTSTLDFLRLLASTSLLREYGLPDKEDWIAHYLPIALECIGGVHDLLEQGETVERDGVLRVLDASLLIVRAIFEDEGNPDDPGTQGIANVLLPMCSETLTQLAKIAISRFERGGLSDVSISFGHVLESCLYLLSKLSPMVKQNRNNQFVQAVKDLITIIQVEHELTPSCVHIATFVRDALSDVVVAPSDGDVVWKLFSRLVYKLSALLFGLQVNPASQPLTPPQSVCLEALYALLSKSNLPDYASKKHSLQDWLVPHARTRFAAVIQTQCEGPQRPTKQSFCDWYRYPSLDKKFTSQILNVSEGFQISRLPGEVQEALPPDRATNPHVTADVYEVDGELEAAKQMKWEDFTATYWALHDRLARLECSEDQRSFLENVSEVDLECASSGLKTLLTKTSTGW